MSKKENKCCLNCVFYESNKKIQCKPFAKAVEWTKEIFEIDSPYSIKCKAYKEQK